MVSKVLILTASYGTGHVVVASALSEAFQKKGITPTILDLVEIGGVGEKAAAKLYSLLMKNGHLVWNFYHEKIMPLKKGDSIRKIFAAVHKNKFFKEIEAINPDIIVATMDTACVVASLYQKKHPGVKITTVITDYVAHELWVWENMDHYFIGSDEIQKYLEKHGITDSKIHKTGIPLRPQFEDLPSKKEARKMLGIPDDGRKVLLISVGSFGSVPISKILQTLIDRQDVFVMVMAGSEEKIPEYADMLQTNGLVGKVVGYTNEISIFMVASDLFISKAGGVTTAECLAAGLPAIYVHNFPGHETGNAVYTEKHYAAKSAKNTDELKKILSELLEDKPLLEKMSRNAKKLSSPYASDTIVDILL